MASPFSIFRKNQKLMLVILGVMCMLAFVVLPSLMQIMRSGGGGGSQVVVTSKFGSINEAELLGMRRTRKITNKFVAELIALSGEVDPRRIPAEPLGSSSEEDVVTTMLLARRAEEMGVVVSNDAVRGFLREITRDQVNSADMRALIGQLGISQGQLFDALRNELAARASRPC
ncbi:MAG: SurA N-terminal domain-containing protein [Pirellulales bacterium]